MIRRPPRSTQSRSSAASDVYKRQVTGVAWLSQSFLQLVLLPIIIVGQNIISASQDARAEADHITLTTLHAMNVRQLQMLEQQQQILQQQQTILELLKTKAA